MGHIRKTLLDCDGKNPQNMAQLKDMEEAKGAREKGTLSWPYAK
jgi:hypothetical protein